MHFFAEDSERKMLLYIQIYNIYKFEKYVEGTICAQTPKYTLSFQTIKLYRFSQKRKKSMMTSFWTYRSYHQKFCKFINSG